jgi:hypothetical protein
MSAVVNNDAKFTIRVTGVAPPPPTLSSLLSSSSLIGKKNRGKKRGNQLCCSVCNNTLYTLAILPLFTFPASVHWHVLRKEFEGSSFRNSKTKNSGNCTQELTSMFVFVPQQLQKKEPPSQTHANVEVEEPEKLAILFACVCARCCVHQQAHNLLNCAARTCLLAW